MKRMIIVFLLMALFPLGISAWANEFPELERALTSPAEWMGILDSLPPLPGTTYTIQEGEYFFTPKPTSPDSILSVIAWWVAYCQVEWKGEIVRGISLNMSYADRLSAEGSAIPRHILPKLSTEVDSLYLILITLKIGDGEIDLKRLGGPWLIKKDEVMIIDKLDKPSDFILAQNYPNPFNPQTTINYNVLEPDNVKLAVYNIKGQIVSTLVNNFQPAGSYSVNFDGANLPSGVYFYKLETDNFQKTRKMNLIK